MNPGTNENSGPPSADSVREVVRSAERELQQLMRQRAEIMKRIGTIKQTLAGLANIFGDDLLDDELLELLDRKPARRRSGFTRACRLVLMNSDSPLCGRQMCEQIQQRFPDLHERHKNLHASVTTVLSRLVDYAEARTFLLEDGQRVWQWIAGPSDELSEEDAILPAGESIV